MVLYIRKKCHDSDCSAIVTQRPLVTFIVTLRFTYKFSLQYFYALLKFAFFWDLYEDILFL